MNYYDLLQVNKDASQDEVADAFRRLIKQYHPDRFSDPEEKRTAEKKFSEISSAFNVLKDPDKRKGYDQSLGDTSTRISHEDTKAQAQQFFKNGLHQLNNKQDYRMAEEFFKKAAHLDKDNAKYLFYLGTCQAQDPRKRRDAVQNLERAISLDPFPAIYRARVGTIYAKAGMRTRAIKFFEKALKLDESCDEALEGLEQLGVKVKSTEKPRGFLGKLFGKG